jgi:hypothetical protein
MGKKTTYVCPDCPEKVTVFVTLSEPPVHQCGGSSRPDKSLPLVDASTLKKSKQQS